MGKGHALYSQKLAPNCNQKLQRGCDLGATVNHLAHLPLVWLAIFAS